MGGYRIRPLKPKSPAKDKAKDKATGPTIPQSTGEASGFRRIISQENTVQRRMMSTKTTSSGKTEWQQLCEVYQTQSSRSCAGATSETMATGPSRSAEFDPNPVTIRYPQISIPANFVPIRVEYLPNVATTPQGVTIVQEPGHPVVKISPQPDFKMMPEPGSSGMKQVVVKEYIPQEFQSQGVPVFPSFAAVVPLSSGIQPDVVKRFTPQEFQSPGVIGPIRAKRTPGLGPYPPQVTVPRPGFLPANGHSEQMKATNGPLRRIAEGNRDSPLPNLRFEISDEHAIYRGTPYEGIRVNNPHTITARTFENASNPNGVTNNQPYITDQAMSTHPRVHKFVYCHQCSTATAQTSERPRENSVDSSVPETLFYHIEDDHKKRK